MKVVVEVWLKQGIPDPVGKDLAKKARVVHGLPVVSIATGKRFDLEIAATEENEARRIVDEACKQLLVNKTVERYEIVSIGKK